MRAHAMLDLETFGINSDAPILSACPMFFHPGTGAILASRTFVFDVNKQNRIPNFNTVKWWMKQDSAAAAHWLDAEKYDTVTDFAAYCRSRTYDMHVIGYDQGVTWWAKSPSFDMVLANSLLREFNEPLPWSYRDWRDVRTVESFLEDREFDDSGFAAHDPKADCQMQIARVVRFHQQLGQYQG